MAQGTRVYDRHQEDSERASEHTVHVGAMALVLEEDREPYEVHPRVGIVATTTITVMTHRETTVRHNAMIPVRSAGVWGIEDPTLVAGQPIPASSWVREVYGADEIAALKGIISALSQWRGDWHATEEAR